MSGYVELDDGGRVRRIPTDALLAVLSGEYDVRAALEEQIARARANSPSGEAHKPDQFRSPE